MFINDSNYNFKNSNISSLSEKTSKVSSKVSFASKNIDFDVLTFTDEILREIKREIELQTLIEVFSMPNIRRCLKTQKKMSIRELFDNILGSNQYGTKELLIESGIDNVAKLDNFVSIININPKNKKIFEGQLYEAVKIYGAINNKDDISKFPELLLHLHNRERKSKAKNTDILNKTVATLKILGVNNQEDFDKKYSNLSDFLDFETIADKTNVIFHIVETFGDKINKINKLIEENPEKYTEEDCEIYGNNSEYIDYIYLKDNGNLNKFDEIYDEIAAFKKLKTKSLISIAPFFNDFNKTSDKIDFLTFLKENNVSVNEFVSLCSKGFVNDQSNVLARIIHKESLTQFISETQNKTEKESFEVYKNFSDILSLLYGDKNLLSEIEEFLNIIKRYKLANSDSFKSLYQRIFNKNIKQLTKEQILELIELLRYSPSPDLFKEAKENKLTPLKFLELKKEEFLKIEDEITQYIINDSTNYFADKDAAEIYLNFYELFQKSSDTASVLEEISKLNIENIEDYKNKTRSIEEFSKFFDSKKELHDFIVQNDISFSDTEEEKTYRQNCLSVLETLYDKEDLEKTKERIRFFSEVKLFSKSKADLDFIIQNTDLSEREEVFRLIADKKVSSFEEFFKFFEKYSSSKEEQKILFDYLKNTQNTDFETLLEIINSIRKKMNSLNIPLEIDSSNIDLIEPDKFCKDSNIRTGQILYLLKNIAQRNTEGNFLTMLNANKKETTPNFDSFDIAYEIAAKMNKSDESYQNIVKLLKLEKSDLNLDENCSEYTHASAIEKKLDKRITDFICSNNWLKYSDSKPAPDVVLHARMRLLDRFILNDVENIEELFQEKTQEKIKEIIKTIYTKNPDNIEAHNSTKRMVAKYQLNNSNLQAVFTPDGSMITVMPVK